MALVSPIQPPARISDAIRKASEATGTDFDYLLATAARESNFKPNATAKTSSAAGLFQFIESTWLQTVKEQGGRFGLEKYSPHIFQTESGRYYVPNNEIRKEILNLRHNPEVSAMMAGAFTQQNAEYVSERLGRDPSQGELYIAHFLGAGGATKLITLASQDPNARADSHFPRAAKANRSIFYSHRQARSVQQVYEQLVSDHSKLGAMSLAVSTPGQSRPAQATAGVPQPKAHPDPALQMSVLNDAASASAQGVSAAAAPVTTISPMSRTRVAALSWSPLPVGTETDSSLGGIGSWHTIVQPEPATRSAASKPEITPSDSPEPPAAHFRAEPDRVPLRTRLHGGAPAPATEAATATQVAARSETEQAPAQPRYPVLQNFARNYWEQQALSGG
jgi:hypothetical protein